MHKNNENLAIINSNRFNEFIEEDEVNSNSNIESMLCEQFIYILKECKERKKYIIQNK